MVAAVRAGRLTTLDDARLPTLDIERLRAPAAAKLLDRRAPELHPVLRARVLAEAAGNPLALGRARPHGAGVGDALDAGSANA